MTELTIVSSTLPSLKQAEESVLSFTPEYLDVDELEEGRKFRCFYLGIQERDHADQETGELKKLVCAQIAEQQEDGKIKVWESAANQLVGVLRDKEKAGVILPGKTALVITYKGKKKNKTNNYKSARWDIRQLIINEAA